MSSTIEGLAKSRPEEWKRGVEIGAITANEFTPSGVFGEDIKAVGEIMLMESIGRDRARPEHKVTPDTEGAAAYVLGALGAICETLSRKAQEAA